MKTPILGSAYETRSVNAAANRMVNLFPEIIPEGGKEPAFLVRAPGLKLKVSVGDGPIRGMRTCNNKLYVVSGDKLYEVDTAYVVTERGTVSGSPAVVSMAENGIQLFVACNPKGYIYNTSTQAFQEITDADFPGASSVTYLDGYFVFSEPNSQKIWVTSLLDGTSIDPLDFASAEGSPDRVIGIIADHRELWVFGNDSTEVWYNSGGTDFPLSRIQGAFNETGCVAPHSVVKLDNRLFWLGQDARGQGVVYQASGYIAHRVSTHAIEWRIGQYGDLSNAIGYSYQQDGHGFYVLIFPNADTTWVYDAASQAWHERAEFNTNLFKFTRHRSNCQTFFNSDVLVGDYSNGNVYSFDLTEYSDNGETQKWLRSWRACPTGENTLTRTAHHSLQLDLETGVGLSELVQGNEPQVMLRWSDDGGHTWSNEHWASIGKIGEYSRRAIWRRLGMTTKLRDRVYEISGTDPVKIAILGAELVASGTNA